MGCHWSLKEWRPVTLRMRRRQAIFQAGVPGLGICSAAGTLQTRGACVSAAGTPSATMWLPAFACACLAKHAGGVQAPAVGEMRHDAIVDPREARPPRLQGTRLRQEARDTSSSALQHSPAARDRGHSMKTVSAHPPIPKSPLLHPRGRFQQHSCPPHMGAGHTGPPAAQGHPSQRPHPCRESVGSTPAAIRASTFRASSSRAGRTPTAPHTGDAPSGIRAAVWRCRKAWSVRHRACEPGRTCDLQVDTKLALEAGVTASQLGPTGRMAERAQGADGV